MNAWCRVPVIVRAVLTGLLVAVVVTYPWAYLVDLNTRHWTAVPWAVVPTAIWLAIWWRYISGHGWPASTSSARRAALRARNVSDDQWGSALLAGILGLAASLAILNLTNRWLPVPQESLANSVLSRIPAFTVIISTLMGSAVAGIVEEASFRGYMQGAIERRHGPVVAIGVTSVVFGLAHVGHAGLLAMMPFYVAVGTTYGLLAYFTGSIFPSMMLHAGSDALGGLTALAQGSSSSSVPVPSIPPERPMWGILAWLVVTAVAAAASYRALAAGATRAPHHG